MCVFIICVLLCFFLPGQLQLAADDEEDFSVSVAAHGVESIVLSRLALEDRQVCFEARFQAVQNPLTGVGSQDSQQLTPLAPGAVCQFLQCLGVHRACSVGDAMDGEETCSACRAC